MEQERGTWGVGLETYTAPGGYFLPAGKEASHDRTATGQDVITVAVTQPQPGTVHQPFLKMTKGFLKGDNYF